MTFGIECLPDEIIGIVLKSLDDKRALVDLACCSHRWYTLVAPYLYQRLQIDRIRPQDDQSWMASEDLRCLTELFLRKPMLAHHTRHLSIRPWYKDGDSDLPEYVEYEEDNCSHGPILEDVKMSIANASHSEEEEEKWTRDLYCPSEGKSNGDAYMALLLPLLSNLKTMDIEISQMPEYTDRMIWRAALRQSPFDAQPALHKVRQVVLANETPECDGSLYGIGCLLLPSVRAVFFNHMGSDPDYGHREQLREVAAKSSKCTHIELRECRYNDEDIVMLNSIPERLTTFVYELSCSFLFFEATFEAIGRALEQHRNHLEDIWLGEGMRGMIFGPGGIRTGGSPIESLRTFTSLRRLRISPIYVFGWNANEEQNQNQNWAKKLLDFLPKQLEVLHLIHCGRFDSALLYSGIKLLLSDAWSFPALKTLLIDTSLSAIERDKDLLLSLYRLATEKGLKMVLRNDWSEHVPGAPHKSERKWGFDEDIEWKPCTNGINERAPPQVVELSGE